MDFSQQVREIYGSDIVPAAVGLTSLSKKKQKKKNVVNFTHKLFSIQKPPIGILLEEIAYSTAGWKKNSSTIPSRV